MNATIKLEKKHFPVLLEELISIISPLYGGTFIDCTFGQGGYSKKILEHKKNKVIALDRDKDVTLKASELRSKFGERFKFENLKFSELDKINLKNHAVKAVIFDLGISTTQINDPKKGISFNYKGQLNMGMGLNKFNAHDVINKTSEDTLVKIFKYFGEEKLSKLIAKKLVLERKNKIIDTEKLVNIIDSVKKKNKKKNT